jgi:hypothetical protein
LIGLDAGQSEKTPEFLGIIGKESERLNRDLLGGRLATGH